MNEKERDKLTAFIASLQGRRTFTEAEVKQVIVYLSILLKLGKRLAGDWSEQ